jgi:hypothetical protein
MRTVRIYADETGNFDFSRTEGASRYFGVGTLEIDDAAMKALHDDLVALRYELSGNSHDGRRFHATSDKQAVRDRVFEVLLGHEFRFDATMLEKSKAQPHLRATDASFFQYAWYYHFKHHAPRLRRCDLGVYVSDLKIKNLRSSFHSAVTSVVSQCLPAQRCHVNFWSSDSDPCLQAADYCLWAISRHYERGDDRSLRLIAPKLGSHFDLFAVGKTEYY